MKHLQVVVAVALASNVAHAGPEAGLDIGHVVDHAVVHDAFARVDSTRVGWVRINFRLDDWTAPDDATRRGPDQLTFFEAYDRVVDAYLPRGIAVYGLVNDESVGASALDHNSDAWIKLYVANAVKIVDHFKNRVRVYEVINEPNDYAGGTTARFTPAAFAQILQDTYLAVKHDNGHASDRCWQVQLVSGPILSADAFDGHDYLQATYAAGRNQLAWERTRQATGSFPLDGIGYHAYVGQGAGDAAVVAPKLSANLAAAWSVVTANEPDGAATAKRLWLSELGWRADVVGASGQADRIRTAFATMRQDGHVALGVYFNLEDFPGNEWGVFDGGGARRPSADMLAAVADGDRPDHGARVASVVVPALAPGALGDVVVTLENRGARTWTSGFRLGAAPGCPDAASTNALAWEPSAGYVHAITDARVFLPHDVAPGETIALHVPVRAPAAAGHYGFAARMVEDGVAWFGPTVTADVTVADGGSGSGSGNGSGDGGGGHAGCAAGGASNGSAGALALAAACAIGAGRRRRRATS